MGAYFPLFDKSAFEQGRQKANLTNIDVLSDKKNSLAS